MINRYLVSMKPVFFLVFLMGMVSNSYAQQEMNSTFKAVPLKKKDLKIKPIISRDPGPPRVIPYVADVIPENTFKVPKSTIIDAAAAYNRNQYLGIFKTSSETAKIKYRDGAFVDGDRIRIYVNYKVVEYEVLLGKDFQGFEIKLEKGINSIDFEALNEGFASPNTAEFEVYDDKGKRISFSQWNIGKGFKATIVVDKE